jgi:transposase InsO family protein
MSYSNNPNLGKVRADAVKMVRGGSGVREVARHFGYAPSTVTKWCQKVENEGLFTLRRIPTESSRPHHHPRELPEDVITAILELRKDTGRGAEYIHQMLLKRGVLTSLSSVKRTLTRHGLTRFSKWKKWHQSAPRPLPERPGLLVETDTVHDGPSGHQIYLYTLIDVNSRWAYAEATDRIGAMKSGEFVVRAQQVAPFQFDVIQSDHGAEFSTFFTKKLAEPDLAIRHRYTRIRKPNDNAHIERFNRTIQEECTFRISRDLNRWNEELPKYLYHYNYERVHMGLDWKTPMEKLQETKSGLV